MPSLLWFLFVGVIMTGVAAVAYRVGVDAAEREAFYTITQLRRDLRIARLEAARTNERYRIANNRTSPVWHVEEDERP